MTHFAFLDAEWPEIAFDAKKAEAAVYQDPRTACFYARRTLELSVAWLYRSDRSLKLPYDDSLSSLLHAPEFRTLIGQPLHTKAKLIRELGNRAVHSTRRIEANDAVTAVRELFHFCYWLARTYGRRGRPEPGLAFKPELLARAGQLAAQTSAQLQKLEAALAEKDQKLRDVLGAKTTLDAELEALRAEVAATRAANSAQPDTHDYNEAQTRDAFIDLLLGEAGWALAKSEDREFPVKGMPNNNGDGFVDYVLWGDDGKPLGLVEAKRTKRDAREGQQQAKLYADCLEKQFGQRPVIFYSNGYEHWIWDDASYPPRPIQGFHKKDELALLVQRRTTRGALGSTPINAEIVGRPYQTRAIRRIGEAFERDHDRKALVVMATGAGKTRTVIALADVLMRANWAKRILFLADRVALVNQAVKAFKAHLPTAAPVNLVTERNAEGRVYVSTYPTMMGLINEKDEERRFGVGHFDLIIIDEAHRSVYQRYRAIFDYYDSLLVGLTATPKDEIDRNTYNLFDLESGVPTDAYGLDEAVKDGYLVPPRAVSVPMRFQRQGIKYDDLPEDEKDQWDAIEWNEDGSVPTEIDPAALNAWLFNEDTVDKVLQTLVTKGVSVAGGDRLGKTIVFAKNHAHAVFIAERFDKNYPHHKGHFARVIDFQTEYAQSLIDDFSNAERAPHIAISVDMLDTGIDVPEVVNLVFFKVVRSKTKFWQMIGRGTRLRADLFGPGQDKEFFAVFDFCQNLEFFSQNPDTIESAAGSSLAKRLFTARLAVIGEIDKRPTEDGERALRSDIAGWLHDEVAAMNLDNFVIRPKRKFIETYREAGAWTELSAEAQHELIEHIAGLPSPHGEDEEEAKRFDLMMLRLQLALLRADPEFNSLKQRVQDIAAALEAQASIPMIREALDLLQNVQTAEYWQDVTLPMLETLRKRLRNLVKLIEKGKKKIVYTNFEDEIGEGTAIELPGITVGMDFERFKAKARHFLKAHEDHLSIHKLKRNQPLTATDLAELERMLIEAGGEASHVSKAKELGLVLFVRSLVGMERAAATEAFASFMNGKQLTANQIEFVNLIIDHLTEHGALEKERLYESPFTDLNSRGVEGLFPPSDISELFGVLDRFVASAA